MTKTQRVGDTDQQHNGHIAQFGLAEFRFWLSAFVGRGSGPARQITPSRDSPVGVYPLPLDLWTSKGLRLRQFDAV